MEDSPVLNPGLEPNQVVPGSPHTEPSFVRPVYEEEVKEVEESAPVRRGRPPKK